MPYQNENQMYPVVCKWLHDYLCNRHRNARIYVFESPRKSLSRLIEEKGLITNLPSEWHSWDIHVDIVGFIITKKTNHLSFVECKNKAITLGNLSQLLGYSRVALPLYSFIVAPQGASDSLRSLILTFNRTDILKYYYQGGKFARSIIIARWDETANCIDKDSILAGDKELGTL